MDFGIKKELRNAEFEWGMKVKKEWMKAIYERQMEMKRLVFKAKDFFGESEAGMHNRSPDLRVRTKAFAIRVLRLIDALPRKMSCDVIARQLMRSATSVGANYRSACRARSTAEFCAKLGIVEEEADESLYWLEMLGDAELMKPELLVELQKEAGEIVAMVVASIRTARQRK